MFILSKGHACVSVYATLGLLDFFPISELDSYGKNDSNLMHAQT
jgi:transketolase